MISNRITFLMFGIIFFAGTVSARHPPALFLTRFETPDDFYNDEIQFNERKYQEEQRPSAESKWPWSKMFDNEFVKDHQPARGNAKNEGDESNVVNDFPEYSTEHLPMPQGLIQNYIKGRTAKKNSNQYMSVCHFKICNMGRKRNTRHLHLNNPMNPLPWRS
ncbi:uncharacterized protein LOC119071592 isoform X2 [Bradysia coprophila]|uniref:uncharacterized protein LOC119071592 isoform X2 n=1 Tax=Bradysia coprophila TaxID=38358 RepID=UPI00187DC201|nr:uncharacterized protein LOC119071592 isoform X2 [Bradysia coprophila]XP_037032440.1 uncharacterized protein LOC119071592 isoform X2 [Bradysia coprophila]